jgi:hypothetical protein
VIKAVAIACHSFDPVLSKPAAMRVLILGSMPRSISQSRLCGIKYC